MAKELTCACYISIDGADPVPVESLNAEQIVEYSGNASERLSRNMSAYYSTHMGEYIKLKSTEKRKSGNNND